MFSAAAFQLVTMPSSVLPMIASPDDCTIAATSVRSVSRLASAASLAIRSSSSIRLRSAISICSASFAARICAGPGSFRLRRTSGQRTIAVTTETTAVVAFSTASMTYSGYHSRNMPIRCVAPQDRMNAANIHRIQRCGKSRRLRAKWTSASGIEKYARAVSRSLTKNVASSGFDQLMQYPWGRKPFAASSPVIDSSTVRVPGGAGVATGAILPRDPRCGRPSRQE